MGVWGGWVMPFLNRSSQRGRRVKKKIKRKLKTILQDTVVSDALYVSLSELYWCHLLFYLSKERHYC